MADGGKGSLSARSNAQQAELRTEITRVIGKDELKLLRELKVVHTFKDALTIYVLLGATIAVTCWLHREIGYWTLLLTPLLAFVSGVAFNWINVQIHEASHHLLLPNKRWNDLFCNLALGCWGMQDVQTYRATHGMHHSYLHTERDPDLWVYTSRVGSLRAVLSGVLEDLSLLTILRRKQQLSAFVSEERPREAVPLYVRGAKVLAQVLVLSVFVAACGWMGAIYYGAVYAYGLMAVFPALVRIRTVVQHYERAEDGTPGQFTSRTTESSFVEFLVIGARMDYHFEHHLYPNIPYYNLRAMHRLLRDARLFEHVREQTGQALHTDDYLKSFRELST